MKMRTLTVACALLITLLGGASAQQLKDVNVPQTHELNLSDIQKQCSTPISTPLNDPDPAAMAYLKNCMELAAKHNTAVLRMQDIQFILWDFEHDVISGYVTRSDANVDKGDNEGADIYARGDLGFQVLLDALEDREEHSFDARFNPTGK